MKIKELLEIAEIIGIDDYLIHNWDMDDGLQLSYTDGEGLIFEFDFSEESLEDGEINDNCISLIDTTGEKVHLFLYKLTAINTK